MSWRMRRKTYRLGLSCFKFPLLVIWPTSTSEFLLQTSPACQPAVVASCGSGGMCDLRHNCCPRIPIWRCPIASKGVATVPDLILGQHFPICKLWNHRMFASLQFGHDLHTCQCIIMYTSEFSWSSTILKPGACKGPWVSHRSDDPEGLPDKSDGQSRPKHIWLENAWPLGDTDHWSPLQTIIGHFWYYNYPYGQSHLYWPFGDQFADQVGYHQATRSSVAVGCKVKGQPRCHVLCCGAYSGACEKCRFLTGGLLLRSPSSLWRQPVERTFLGTVTPHAYCTHYIIRHHTTGSSWVYPVASGYQLQSVASVASLAPWPNQPIKSYQSIGWSPPIARHFWVLCSVRLPKVRIRNIANSMPNSCFLCSNPFKSNRSEECLKDAHIQKQYQV